MQTLSRSDLLPPLGQGHSLTNAEKRLIAFAESGERWTPDGGPALAPARDSEWPENYRLSATLLRCLLTGSPWFEGGKAFPISPRGLWIENAYIADTLDLAGCHILVPLWFKTCVFAQGVRLRDAKTQTLGFNGCVIHTTPVTTSFDPISIDAVRAHINGKLYLADNFLALGEVNFASAKIAGQMECKNGRFNGTEYDRGQKKDLVALRCDAIEISDGVLLTNGFHASATVDFEGARIDSTFDCSGGTFDNPSGTALNCTGIRVGGDLKLSFHDRRKDIKDNGLPHFVARGFVALQGAKIEGVLDCSGGNFHCTDPSSTHNERIALQGDGIHVGGNVNFYDTKAVGIVRLRTGQVGGHFHCDGADFRTTQTGEEQIYALQCMGIRVGDQVSLNGGTFGEGGVDFRRAVIGGSFYCWDAKFHNPGRHSVGPNDIALRLSYAKISAGLYLEKIKQFTGCLVLEQAEVKTVHDDGSAWMPPELRDHPQMGEVLSIPSPKKQTRSYYKALRKTLKERDRRERNSEMFEHPLGTCLIRFDGFTYQRYIHPRLGEEQFSDLLEAWLRCQPRKCKLDDFKPQPWQQAATVMREMGHVEFSRRISVALRKIDGRRPNTRGQRKRIPYCFGRVWSFLYHWTVGYGYRPFWPLWWSAAIIFLGWAVFASASNLGYMAPREGAVVAYLANHESDKRPVPDFYPHFNALIYSIDAFIPVLELGQETAWEPSLEQHGVARTDRDVFWPFRIIFGQNLRWSTENTVCKPSTCPLKAANMEIGTAIPFAFGWHRAMYWLEVVAGWIFASLFISGVSGLMKKD